MMNKKSAFTLAEVLLVLAIIGVIAAVTIPAIMQQSSEKKFTALAKKTQSTLQNAIDIKVASVPVGPGDVGIGLFQWLISGEEDGTDTLKVIKTNANSSAIQLADGTILRQNSNTCGTASTRTKVLGCSTEIYVDLNGSDGPTKTTATSAGNILTSSRWNEKKAYDLMIIYATPEGKIRPCNNASLPICNRAVKYLGIAPY